MKHFIKWKEEWVFLFTNNAVDNIRNSEWFNSNHLAKVLYEQCEMYKHIISNLLEQWKSETITKQF